METETENEMKWNTPETDAVTDRTHKCLSTKNVTKNGGREGNRINYTGKWIHWVWEYIKDIYLIIA